MRNNGQVLTRRIQLVKQTNHVQPCSSLNYTETDSSQQSFPVHIYDTVSHSGLVQGDFKRPNAWSYSNTRMAAPRGSAHAHWKNSPTTCNWSDRRVTGVFDLQASNYPPTYNFSPAAYNACLEKLQSKVRGGYDFGIDIAESGETARMAHSWSRWETWFDRHSFLSKAANMHLMIQYGIKPLLQSIYNGADALSRYAFHTCAMRVQASVVQDAVPDWESKLMTFQWHPRQVRVTAQHSGLAGCKVGLVLKLPDHFTSTDYSRFSSMNPLSIGWELMPLSFVADWFVGIGDYLRLLETAMMWNTSFVSGWKTEWVNGVATYDANDSATSLVVGSTVYDFADISVRGSQRTVKASRVLLASYPFPRSPMLKFPTSWQQFASAGALVKQRWRF